MNFSRSLRLAVLAGLCAGLWPGVVVAEEKSRAAAPRVPISKLLNLETRAATLREFLRWSSRDFSREYYTKKNLVEFSRSVGPIEVLPYPAAGVPSGYITFRRDSLDREVLPLSHEPGPFDHGRIFLQRERALMPREHYQISIIRADGTWSREENERGLYLGRGVCADFNGDGQIEMATDSSTSSFTRKENGKEVAYQTDLLRISPFLESFPVGPMPPESFEVGFNLRRSDGLPAERWGWWFEDPDGDGVFDLQLGLLVKGKAEPRVTFHWEAKERKWAAQGLRDEMACRVRVGEESPVQRLSQALEKGTLMVPPASEALPTFDFLSGWEKEVPVAKYSGPYHAASLAGRSPAELLEAMTKRRRIGETGLERRVRASKLPPLAITPAREMARAIFLALDEGSSKDSVWIGFDTLDGAEPPEEGDLTLYDDSQFGCFGPSEPTAIQLRCRRAGSFLAVDQSSMDWAGVPVVLQRNEFEFRRLELSSEEAQRWLQVVWWLSRARIWRAEPGFQSMGRVSMGLQSTTLRLSRGKGRVEMERNSFDEASSKFVEAALWFFKAYLPLELGPRWTATSVAGFGHGGPSVAADLERLHERVRQGLQDFLAEGSSPEALNQVLRAITEHAWPDVRELVARVREALPAPAPEHQRMDEIEKEIAGWVARYGVALAGDRRHSTRDTVREQKAAATAREAAKKVGQSSGISPIPGLDIPDSLGSKVDVPAQELRQFAPLDALYNEHLKLRMGQSRMNAAMHKARRLTAQVLRQLEVQERPAELEEFLRGLKYLEPAGVRQLVRMAPARAAEVLRARIAVEVPFEVDYSRESLAIVNHLGGLPDDSFEAAIAGWRLLRENEVTRLLDYPGVDGQLDYRTANKLARALVPPAEPGRYPWPIIDETLLVHAALHPGNSEVVAALARRGSPSVWEPPKEIPALSFSAFREPEKYRERLRAYLADELKKHREDVGDVAAAAWLCDLRDLGPELESRATGGTGDFDRYAEGGRQHSARWVLTLWNEKDPATRAKLLLAFAIGSQFHPDTTPEAWSRLREQFEEALRPLDEAGRQDVSSFLDWCEKDGQPQVAAVLDLTKAQVTLDALRKLSIR